MSTTPAQGQHANLGSSTSYPGSHRKRFFPHSWKISGLSFTILVPFALCLASQNPQPLAGSSLCAGVLSGEVTVVILCTTEKLKLCNPFLEEKVLVHHCKLPLDSFLFHCTELCGEPPVSEQACFRPILEHGHRLESHKAADVFWRLRSAEEVGGSVDFVPCCASGTSNSACCARPSNSFGWMNRFDLPINPVR